MSNITIPLAALEAGASAIAESLRIARLTTEAQDGYKPEARAACIAMLRAWPGMQHDNYVIVLPLPAEASDE
jgi:hypothetical protein